jgi:hypothetical protein
MVCDGPTKLICDFISKLAARVIFCSKDLLQFASRSQLDNVTCKLVKAKIIVRLADGVFCRNDKSDPVLPTLWAIKEAKARVFKRRLAQPEEAVLEKARANGKVKPNTVYTTSSNSSMRTIYGRVHYRKTSPRWLKQTSAKGGELLTRFLQSFWQKIKDPYTQTAIAALIPYTDLNSLSLRPCQEFTQEQHSTS